MALKACKECGREISTEAKTCPHCGKRDPTRTGLSFKQIGCLSFLGLWVMGILIQTSNESPSSSSPASQTAVSSVSRSDPKDIVRDGLSVDFKWRKEGFDNVMMVDFTFTNNTAHAVKDLVVTCKHFASSGTEIDSNTRTIYEVIPAGGKKRVRNFSMGFIHSQARSSSCGIDNFELVS